MGTERTLDRRLRDLGFSEKEARVYLSLIEQGQATAQVVAEHAGINRATTYVALEALKLKGLITSVTDEKTTLYTAHEPSKLLHHIHQEELILEQRKVYARELVSDLNQIRGLVRDRPKVRIFQGAHHVPALQREIRGADSSTFYSITHAQRSSEAWPKERNERHRQRLEERRVRGYTIMVYDPMKPLAPTLLASEECRFLPEGKFPFQIELFMIEDKVVLATLSDDMFGVVIDDRAAYTSFKVLFDSLWEIAGKYASVNQSKT